MSARVTVKGLKVACFDVVSRQPVGVPDKGPSSTDDGVRVARSRMNTRREGEASSAGMRLELSVENIADSSMEYIIC